MHFTFTALWTNTTDDTLIFFLFFSENSILQIMQIVSTGDNLHDLSNYIFWENKQNDWISRQLKFYPESSILLANTMLCLSEVLQYRFDLVNIISNLHRVKCVNRRIIPFNPRVSEIDYSLILDIPTVASGVSFKNPKPNENQCINKCH